MPAEGFPGFEGIPRTSGSSTPLVAVLGASGFLGSAVIAELSRAPVRLRAVARDRTPLPSGSTAEVMRVDLTEPGAPEAAVAGADVVLHLAADIGGDQSWRGTGTGSRARRVNVELMRELLDAIERRGGTPPALVFASTLQAESPRCAGAYVEQKIEAERELLRATADGAVAGTVLRLSTVFGRSPVSGSLGRGVVPAMARRALAGLPITMWHDGSVERDLLDVRDAAAAFRAACEHMPALRGDRWVVGRGASVPLGEVFGTLAEVVAERTGREPVPVRSVPPPDHAAAGDFTSLPADPAPFQAATGWCAGVSLRDGLRELVMAADEAVTERV